MEGIISSQPFTFVNNTFSALFCRSLNQSLSAVPASPLACYHHYYINNHNNNHPLYCPPTHTLTVCQALSSPYAIVKDKLPWSHSLTVSKIFFKLLQNVWTCQPRDSRVTGSQGHRSQVTPLLAASQLLTCVQPCVPVQSPDVTASPRVRSERWVVGWVEVF